MACTYVPDFAFIWTFYCSSRSQGTALVILLNFFWNSPELRTVLETTCWLHMSPSSAWPEFETLKYDWIVHFLQPWEALLFSLKILFPWVFGLYKIQLVNSSAHHLEKNPAYISPPHRLSIWLQSSLKTPLPPLCRRCLDFQHSLNYDLFLSQCLLTLKTIL